MSSYYNPDRGGDWNYGGKRWRLSRSKIDLFVECPRCFWLDNKLGTKRPPGYPFNLNVAVDTLLKKEFDIHRADKTPHPLMAEHGLDAVPFQHAKMDIWRDNFKGIDFPHEATGLVISGAIDDVWQKSNGELIIADYKATSKDAEVSLDAEWQDGYKRQMEVYQWLFRKNGFEVSDTGYFVYVNGRTDVDTFDAKLEFDISLLSYTGNGDWIEEVLLNIKACLESDQIPEPHSDCDYCRYRETAGKKLQAIHKGQSLSSAVKAPAKEPKKKAEPKIPQEDGASTKTDSLF